MLSIILMAFSLVCFVVAVFVSVPRFNLLAAGLAFLTAAMLFGGLPTLA